MRRRTARWRRAEVCDVCPPPCVQVSPRTARTASRGVAAGTLAGHGRHVLQADHAKPPQSGVQRPARRLCLCDSPPLLPLMTRRGAWRLHDSAAPLRPAVAIPFDSAAIGCFCGRRLPVPTASSWRDVVHRGAMHAFPALLLWGPLVAYRHQNVSFCLSAGFAGLAADVPTSCAPVCRLVVVCVCPRACFMGPQYINTRPLRWPHFNLVAALSAGSDRMGPASCRCPGRQTGAVAPSGPRNKQKADFKRSKNVRVISSGFKLRIAALEILFLTENTRIYCLVLVCKFHRFRLVG